MPKAELKTKNSTKRRRKVSFGWVFGFQLNLLEKNLSTLLEFTFTKFNHKWLITKFVFFRLYYNIVIIQNSYGNETILQIYYLSCLPIHKLAHFQV